MASNGTLMQEDNPRIFKNPWPAMGVGLGLVLLAVLALPTSGPWVWGRFVMVVATALAAGIGVVIRPASPGVLGLASVVSFLGSMVLAAPVRKQLKYQFGSGIHHVAQSLELLPGWDSAIILLWFLGVIAAVAALLMLLPQTPRRIAVSAILLFHFGGIFTAVTSASPQPWLSGQIWTYVYRPYLYFMYLNNAYHFYSPEPGPAALLWFRIEYENKDGERHWRWLKVPNLDDNGDPEPKMPNLQYTRRLSLADYANQPAIAPTEDVFLKVLVPARLAAAERRTAQPLDSPNFRAHIIRGIPTHPEYPLTAQYREPNSFSKYWMKSFITHVADAYPHEKHPKLEVTGIKVYKVVHRLPSAMEVAAKKDLNDPDTFLPYYMGEFDRDGNLKDMYGNKWDGDVAKKDPLLYWLIPILKIERGDDSEVKNFLKIHAGEDDDGSMP